MHRRVPMVVLVSVVAVGIFASSQERDQRQPPILPVDGASVFRNYCAACHGPGGRGDGPVAKALKGKVPDLTTLSRRNGGVFPATHVRSTIMSAPGNLLPAHGSRQMPIWGPIFHDIEFDQDLGNVRLENVTKYLESMQRK